MLPVPANMFRTLAILCLVAAPAFGVLWQPGLRMKFGMGVFGIGGEAFIGLPQTKSSASSDKWIEKERPEGPPGLESLVLMCPSNDNTVCVLIDDFDEVVGVQIAIDEKKLSGSIFDWHTQGFATWNTTNAKGENRTYWTTQQYYVSAETLAVNSDKRIRRESRGPFLYDGGIWVHGFNRELYRIPTDINELTGENSDFTLQACIPFMGTHYYFKMNNSTKCNADTILPYFPLVYDDQVVGLGLIITGKMTLDKGERNWFEEPTSAVVKAIVTSGPECLYALADNPGLVTLHTYFIEHPRRITCIGNVG